VSIASAADDASFESASVIGTSWFSAGGFVVGGEIFLMI